MPEACLYDLRRSVRSADFATLFPGWAADEHVAVLSPHDDDALLGAGYAIYAAKVRRVPVSVLIVCDGCAGYSLPEQKPVIVSLRREETVEAYAALGVAPADLHRFDVPDFSAVGRIGWHLPGNEKGVITDLVVELRRRKVTRLLIPNGFREHLDHEAAFDLGRYAASQTGDPVLVDRAAPFSIRSVHVYSVWGDFPPVSNEPHDLRANKAIVVPEEWEERVRRGIRAFRSQRAIIESLVSAREGRRCPRGYLELYLDYDPRPALDFRPYVDLVRAIDEKNV